MIRNVTGKNYGHYTTAFFDFDGTILESGEGIINAVKYMFSHIGMEETDEKRLRAFIGPPVKNYLRDTYGMDEVLADKAYAFFREYYLDKGIHESRLYKKIADTLKSLKNKNITLYIATCKRESMIPPMLAQYHLADVFSGVFGAHHDIGVFDKTQVLEYALERIGSLSDNAIMIGDRSHDIIGGRSVGLDTAGVLYGYGDEDELLDAGCDFLLESVSDLSVLLGGIK